MNKSEIIAIVSSCWTASDLHGSFERYRVIRLKRKTSGDRWRCAFYSVQAVPIAHQRPSASVITFARADCASAAATKFYVYLIRRSRKTRSRIDGGALRRTCL